MDILAEKMKKTRESRLIYKMISKTKLKRHLRMKSNPELVETIRLASKNKGWVHIAKILAGSTRKHSGVNLKEIDKLAREGDTIVVPGKVLGMGRVSKKVRVCALNFAASAREKLKSTKSELVSIMEEIKKNPKAEGIKLLK